MGEVIAINQKRFFTIEEARSHLPIVRRVTRAAFNDVAQLAGQLSYTEDKIRREELEERVRRVFGEWQQKVQRLGCEAKGMWLVDFDTGEGYFCWHYPEPEIDYYHGYGDGFSGRIKLH